MFVSIALTLDLAKSMRKSISRQVGVDFNVKESDQK